MKSKIRDIEQILVGDYRLGHDPEHGPRGAEKTIVCCWDADRLDLSCVGISPDTKSLNPETARLLIAHDWATRRRLVGQ